MINKNGFRVLRIILGATFVWIGTMVWREPLAWGGYIQPWALNLLVGPLERVMLTTAIVDILIGLLLIFNRLTWLATAIASVHLIVILITSGINEATVRDIGILAGTVAITVGMWPKNWKQAIGLK